MNTVHRMPVDEKGGKFAAFFIGVWRVDGVVSPVNPKSIFREELSVRYGNAAPVYVGFIAESLLCLLPNELEDFVGVGEGFPSG